MWHLATAHTQTLHSGWAYNRVKIPLCKKQKRGWAYFCEGTVQEYHVTGTSALDIAVVRTLQIPVLTQKRVASSSGK